MEANIIGRTIKLSGKRKVFLGHLKDEPNFNFVAFTNKDGKLTKLKISDEAMDALITLYEERNRTTSEVFSDTKSDASGKPMYQWQTLASADGSIRAINPPENQKEE